MIAFPLTGEVLALGITDETAILVDFEQTHPFGTGGLCQRPGCRTVHADSENADPPRILPVIAVDVAEAISTRATIGQ